MRTVFSEKGLVIILFVLVFIIFSLAQEDSKKMKPFYAGDSAAVKIPSLSFYSTETNTLLTGDKKAGTILPAK